jgi:hypothetical protein
MATTGHKFDMGPMGRFGHGPNSHWNRTYHGIYGLSRSPLSRFEHQPTLRTMKTTFLFQRGNYVLMLAGLALIVLGFVLMSGGGSEDPNVYNPELFSARRIVVAPFLIVLGFAVEVWAIMRKPKAE